MTQSLTYQEGCSLDWTPTAALVAGEVIQFSDGRAAYAPSAIAAGVKGAVQVDGIVVVEKTASVVMLKGSRVFFDHSANKVHLLQVNDRDFYFGIVTESATAAATTVKVAINADPRYTIDLGQGFSSLPISTAGWTHLIGHKEGCSFIFDATAEAQKLDGLSQNGVALATPCMAEALISVNVNGDAALDFNVGLANETHATDGDTIAESLFCHIDGGSLNILVESDDGSTEVAATDTTVDAVLLTPFLIQFDLSDWSDIQVYIDGVNVLPSSVFKLNAATGPLQLLAHMEKTADASLGSYTVMRLGLRSFEE